MADEPPRSSNHFTVILVVSVLTCVGLIVFLVWKWPAILADGSVDANTWAGFVGNLLAGLLGGVAAYLVLRGSIAHERSKAESERSREDEERRFDLADELGELVGTIDLGYGLNLQELGTVSRRASRLVRKIDRAWEGQPAARHAAIALSRGVQAFRDALDQGLNDETVRWLGEELLPAIDTLTSSMIYRDRAIVAADADYVLATANGCPPGGHPSQIF